MYNYLRDLLAYRIGGRRVHNGHPKVQRQENPAGAQPRWKPQSEKGHGATPLGVKGLEILESCSCASALEISRN